MTTTNEKKKCTPEEFDSFIKAYPNPLEIDVYRAGDPPLMTYNDFTLGKWPHSIVASCYVDDYMAKDGEFRMYDGFSRPMKQSNWKIMVKA